MPNQKLQEVIKDRYGKIARGGGADFLLPHLRADCDRSMPGRGLYRRGFAVDSQISRFGGGMRQPHGFGA